MRLLSMKRMDSRYITMADVESFELELDDFCEGCGSFEPDVTKIDVSTMEDMLEKTPKFRTYIKCAKCEGCRNAVKNVKNKIV